MTEFHDAHDKEMTVRRSPTCDLDSLYVEHSDPHTVPIPDGADRLMPPPFSVQTNETLRDYDKKNGWGGQYSYVERDRRVDFPLIEEETKQRYLSHVQQWLQDHHDMPFGQNDVQKEWMMTRESVSKTYRQLMNIYDRDGKARFVTITPTFSDFLRAVNERDKCAVQVPMRDSAKGWQLDFETLARTFQPGDVLMLCNPNNPNGYVYSEEDLRTIIGLCKKHNIKIISDDIWSDQIHNPNKRHVPLINIALQEGYAHNTAITYSTGKAFNTSAIPCSVVIVPDPETRKQLMEYPDKPSELGAQLAIGTIQTDGSDYMTHLKPHLRKNMECVSEILREIGCHVHPSDSTSVLFVKPNEAPAKMQMSFIGKIASVFGSNPFPKKTVAELMHELNIGTCDGADFGAPGYIRINIGCPHSVLEHRFKQLKERWLASG